MKKLFTYLNILITFLMLALFISIFAMGFKLITAVFTISHDLIYSEENITAQLFLNKTNDYPNIATEIFFRGIKLTLLIYLLLKFTDFKAIIPDLKNKILFTPKNNKIFRQLGKALIIFSVLMSIIKIFERVINSTEGYMANIGVTIGESIGSRLPLIIMGLLLLIVAKFINEGFELKTENDLTI